MSPVECCYDIHAVLWAVAALDEADPMEAGSFRRERFKDGEVGWGQRWWTAPVPCAVTNLLTRGWVPF
jgi:hypothetical protein